MSDISSQIGVSRHPSKKSTEMSECRGRFTVHFSKTNNKGVGMVEDKVLWHDSKRKKMKLKVSGLFIFTIRRCSHVHEFTDEFKVTGYTTSKVNDKSSKNCVKSYANEHMNGEKRYDYAMIEFETDDGTTATCPAIILGFVRYNTTLGIPTPHFTDEEELLLNTIQENTAVDNNLYVVVHTASGYLSVEQFEKEFVSTFGIGNILNCVYIVNIEAIHGPLFVFRNYGSIGEEMEIGAIL
jgi:hypothetical protein